MSRRAGRRLHLLAREQRRRAILANRRPLAVITIASTAFVVVLVAVMGLWKGRELAYFAAGAGMMSVAFVVWFGIDNVQARRLFDAAEAERFTAAELRRLARRGWTSVDHIEFDRLDVDHVAAGPGGVFAIETKWTNESWSVVDGRFDNQYACKAIRQCRDGSERIRQLLKGNYKLNCEVRPLLVVWGPGRPTIEKPIVIEGVVVIPGQLVKEALLAGEAVLCRQEADRIAEALADFTRRREQHDAHKIRRVTQAAV